MRMATVRPDSSRNSRAAASRASTSWMARPPRPAGGSRSCREGAGDGRRDLDRVVERLALDHVVAGQLLLGLGEGAVREQHLAAAHADGGRRARRLQLGAAAQHARGAVASR